MPGKKKDRIKALEASIAKLEQQLKVKKEELRKAQQEEEIKSLLSKILASGMTIEDI